MARVYDMYRYIISDWQFINYYFIYCNSAAAKATTNAYGVLGESLLHYSLPLPIVSIIHIMTIVYDMYGAIDVG